jgi:hypothetical protein
LAQVGAVLIRPSVPTTSSKGRYALQKEFANLFDPNRQGEHLDAAIDRWRQENLSPSELSRTLLKNQSAAAALTKVSVTFPNGETRQMSAGPSSLIAKAVVEQFAPTFLRDPVVIWISESSQKVFYRDDRLAKRLGLSIDEQLLLPDMILADIGAKNTTILFIEVVASDGPMNENRRSTLQEMGIRAGYTPDNLAFLTAFEDRDATPVKKNIGSLAIDTFAWFRTEPDILVDIRSQPEHGSAKTRWTLDDLA